MFTTVSASSKVQKKPGDPGYVAPPNSVLGSVLGTNKGPAITVGGGNAGPDLGLSGMTVGASTPIATTPSTDAPTNAKIRKGLGLDTTADSEGLDSILSDVMNKRKQRGAVASSGVLGG